MENYNSILLNRFFTRNTFKSIIDFGESSTYTSAIQRYVQDPQSKTNKECISEVYEHLRNEYQNEYYYKNTLLNKILLGIHSPRTTTALTELPIGKSKADLILINGVATVYEIRTELDNFDRLDNQIDDYYRAFSKIMVVTSEKKLDIIQRKLKDSPSGICLLTSRGTLSVRKKPEVYTEKLSKTIMFKIFHKAEYEKVLLRQFGSLPTANQFEYYRACQAMFDSLTIETAYRLFVQAIKSRAQIDFDEYAKIPYELKYLVYFSHYNKLDYQKIMNFLCN